MSNSRGLTRVVGFVLSMFVATLLQSAGPSDVAGKQTPADDQSLQHLAALEQNIAAATDKAKRSVVRIVWLNDRAKVEESCSGVILTADGYVATFAYDPSFEMSALPPGKAVSIHMCDGRSLPGLAVASALEWGFGLMKITQAGHWPRAEVGTSEELKLGDVCLALGYPSSTHVGRLPYHREPSLRVGHLTMTADGRWLGTSGRFANGMQGGGLFDLQGRLVGIQVFPRGQIALHSTIEVLQQHWKELAARKPPADIPIGGKAKATGEASDERESRLLPPVDDPRLGPAAAEAKEVTVKIDRVGSGVVVTPDGYVATCAHHGLRHGTDVTIWFGDGHAVRGKILGSDLMLDIGLAKITDPGPWPHAQWRSAAGMKPGDLCLALGYPVHLQRKNRTHLKIRVGRITDNTWFAPWQLESSCQTSSGDSGGGLFNAQGQLIGVHKGGSRPFGSTWHRTIDLFKQHWDFLVSGSSLGEPVPFDRSPAVHAFRKAVEQAPPITVEVFGDQKRRSLGTMVFGDGYVLTKASVLYGSVSCRLADGRVFPAAVINVSREHDLALLKIDATGLPEMPWTSRDEIPVGTFLGALRYGEAPVVGVVGLATHHVPRVPGWLILGDVKDGKGGVEVRELRGFWEFPREMRKEKEGPLRRGDVILRVEGHPTPDVKSFEEVTKRKEHGVWEVPSVIAGDPIRVDVRRGGQDLELRFPLLSVLWDPMGRTSARKSAFPAVFDAEAVITPDTCGGPVVDRLGEVVGISIAVPSEGSVYVVPAAIARKVAEPNCSATSPQSDGRGG